MKSYAQPIKRLIAELAKLPGIGEKTAARLANYILRATPEDVEKLAESLVEVKRKIRLCRICLNPTEEEVCHICGNPARDQHVICVVEEPDALAAIEESGVFHGLYHVLHGALAPLDCPTEIIPGEDLPFDCPTPSVITEFSPDPNATATLPVGETTPPAVIPSQSPDAGLITPSAEVPTDVPGPTPEPTQPTEAPPPPPTEEGRPE